VLADSDAKVVVVEDEEQMEKIRPSAATARSSSR
jgi:hypothetical protein